jgi:eukaryotic-like serine/threonine-protein kinase
MTLANGTRLGRYEIRSPLGAGGKGEVYRANDKELNRDIAIKILPEAFEQDEERVARFKREAQVLASLNHPNIAAIYGLEESDGIRALAMSSWKGQRSPSVGIPETPSRSRSISSRSTRQPN